MINKKRVGTAAALMMTGVVSAVSIAAAAPSKKAGGTAAGRSTKNAYVRVVHGVPDGPPVDVYQGTKRLLANVPYRSVSRYLALPAGTHPIRITAAGQADSLLEIPITVEAGQAYTIAAAGTVKTIRQVTVEDDPPTAAAPAHLRVFHLAPDAPAVAVVAEKPTETPLFSSVSYGKATRYRGLNGRRYVLEVRPAGSPYAVKENVTVTAPRGSRQTAFALGLLKGEDKQAFTLIVTPDELPGK